MDGHLPGQQGLASFFLIPFLCLFRNRTSEEKRKQVFIGQMTFMLPSD